MFEDGLLVFGALAILLAPLALALAETGPGGAGWKLLTFLCSAFAGGFFFRLKSAHRACGVAPSVGMRDGHANELQSTPCVNHHDDEARGIAANIAELPELSQHKT